MSHVENNEQDMKLNLLRSMRDDKALLVFSITLSIMIFMAMSPGATVLAAISGQSASDGMPPALSFGVQIAFLIAFLAGSLLIAFAIGSVLISLLGRRTKTRATPTGPSNPKGNSKDSSQGLAA